MKIKDGFVKQELGEKTIVVSTGDLSTKFHGMIELNYTAADIWDWLSQGYTCYEIANLLAEKYSIELTKAQSDTEKIINKMIAAGGFEKD